MSHASRSFARISLAAIALALTAPTSFAQASQAPARVAAAQPSAARSALPTPERRAWEAASRGPDALRRFIHRTRMIYGLNVYDFKVLR